VLPRDCRRPGAINRGTCSSLAPSPEEST
jgi:hypothetical protein